MTDHRDKERLAAYNKGTEDAFNARTANPDAYSDPELRDAYMCGYAMTLEEESDIDEGRV